MHILPAPIILDIDLTVLMLGLSCVFLSTSHLSIRAGLLSTPVHRADSPVGPGQPQHRPSRQTLRGVRGPQQGGVEQVPERLQGERRGLYNSKH